MRSMVAGAFVLLAGLAVATPAEAIGGGYAEVNVSCRGDGGYVLVDLLDSGGIDFDVYISTDATIDVSDRVYLGQEPEKEFGPYANGVYYVQVDWDEEPLFTEPLFVRLTCPTLELEVSCDDSGGPNIDVTITDADDEEYQIFIDEEFLVEAGVDGTQTFTFGPYDDGEHDVAIDWSGTKKNPHFTDTVVVDCAGGGSGAGLPDAGNDTLMLALLAASLLVVGMGVLTFRRLA